MKSNCYLKLENIFNSIELLKTNLSILYWDQEVCMPLGSAQERGKQLALISRIIHDKITSQEAQELCRNAESETLTEWQKSNLYIIQKQIKLQTTLPGELIEDLSNSTTECLLAWRRARQENNFSIVSNELKKVLLLQKSIATIKSSVLECTPYEALMDENEPGLKTNDLDEIFETVKKASISIMDKYSNDKSIAESFSATYDIEKQKILNSLILKQLGFNYSKGRIDTSTHPFCGGSAEDIRITTRYCERDFTKSLYGSIHEAGHANYNANLPKNWRYQPVGQYLGMAAHESQSLICEYQLAKSRDFLTFLLHHVREVFGQELRISHEKLYQHLNFITPSMIRVDADEVTYPLHIIIRYNLEKSLINNELDVKELPEAWNNAYKNLLGISPKNDVEGCLQDIHWYGGGFGYFPTYTLGAIIAAQLMHHFQSSPDFMAGDFSSGNFISFNRFLNKKVHNHGSFHHNTNSLLLSQFEEKITPDYFTKYLEKKYAS